MIPNFKILLIAAAVVGLLIGVEELRIHWLKGDIEEKEAQITTLQADLAVSQANVSTLKAAVVGQNKALEALKAEKAALDAKARERALSAKRKKNTTPVDASGVDEMNLFFERTYQ